jgi:alpha-ketoglutarate-dependent taurine dioxygenase
MRNVIQTNDDQAARGLKGSPFDLNNDSAYLRWKDGKLDNYPASARDLMVEVDNPMQMSPAEREEIRRRCHIANMAVYVSHRYPSREDIVTLAAQFGLIHLDKHLCAEEDGVSALCDDPSGQRREYIPYSRRPINWHSDGYYNPPEHRIRAMLLHCAQPAAAGGENRLLDHELVYIQLRDQNLDFIKALMQPNVMTIPANIQDGVEIRPVLSGPVFSVDPVSGDLHMRYTARTRSIEWKQDALTLEAVRALEQVLQTDSRWQFQLRLESGQGVITNNVLHTRTAFEDDARQGLTRLVYRVRSYDRIAGTSVQDAHC